MCLTRCKADTPHYHALLHKKDLHVQPASSNMAVQFLFRPTAFDKISQTYAYQSLVCQDVLHMALDCVAADSCATFKKAIWHMRLHS